MDLFSNCCDRLYKAWNVAVRAAWNVPNTTTGILLRKFLGHCTPK